MTIKELIMCQPRACRTDEFEDVISLVNSVFRHNSVQNILTDYPLIFHPSKVDLMRIIKINGEIVSHIPISPREVVAMTDRLKIGIISPTVTHPDYRRKGYGTLCLQDCIRIMETHGWPISVLWTEEATFPFYQKSGWEAVGIQGKAYFLSQYNAELFKPVECEIIPYDPDLHLSSIAKIHNNESYRIERTLEEYKALFNLPKSKTFIATTSSNVSGYVTVSESSNKPGLIESGGDRMSVESLVNFVLKTLPENSSIQVPLPLTHTQIGELLETKMPNMSHPVEEAKGVGHQMVRINDLRLFLEQIIGHLQIMSKNLKTDLSIYCDESQEPVTIGLNKGSVEISSKKASDTIRLSRRDLTKVIFGSHHSNKSVDLSGAAEDVLQQLFPYYFPVWELDHS